MFLSQSSFFNPSHSLKSNFVNLFSLQIIVSIDFGMFDNDVISFSRQSSSLSFVLFEKSRAPVILLFLQRSVSKFGKCSIPLILLINPLAPELTLTSILVTAFSSSWLKTNPSVLSVLKFFDTYSLNVLSGKFVSLISTFPSAA